MPGPLLPFRYSEAEILAIAEVLARSGAGPNALANLEVGLERSTLWFLMMLDHKTILPETELIARLAKLKKAADRVVHHGEMMLGAQLKANNQEPQKVDGKSNTKRSRPSPKRFRERRDSLLAFFPPDPDFLTGQVADGELTDALRQRGDDGDEPLACLVNILRHLLDMDGVSPGTMIAEGLDPADPDSRTRTLVGAAADLSRRAEDGASRIKRVRQLLIRKGSSGNAAVNGWIDDMLGLYKTMTGKPVRTSVGKPGSSNEGMAYGPVIDFLQVASAPLQDHLAATTRSTSLDAAIKPAGSTKHLFPSDGDAWRSRIRTAKNAG